MITITIRGNRSTKTATKTGVGNEKAHFPRFIVCCGTNSATFFPVYLQLSSQIIPTSRYAVPETSAFVLQSIQGHSKSGLTFHNARPGGINSYFMEQHSNIAPTVKYNTSVFVTLAPLLLFGVKNLRKALE